MNRTAGPHNEHMGQNVTSGQSQRAKAAREGTREGFTSRGSLLATGAGRMDVDVMPCQVMTVVLFSVRSIVEMRPA